MDQHSPPDRFAKVLRNREVITLAFGAMIGWSWVLMTGLWVEVAGSIGTLIAFAGGGLAIALIGLTYSELVSAMPRAGGSYIYASRGLHPYLGFVASFSQWFGLSIAIGVVSYVLIPFLRDVVGAVGMQGLAATLDVGWVRVTLALSLG